MTAFIGAPSTWGLLLRTVDVRPRELTCIATSGQRVIAGCEDIVNIYDAVTGVLQQSISTSEPVMKIQASPDGSTLFFAHPSSVTMWDVQTGGLIHTFTTQPKVNDIAVSITGDHIACGSSNGCVKFWNTHTKEEGKGFSNSQPVVTICWQSPQKLAVATQNSLCIYSVTAGKTLASFPFPDCVWGMVCSAEEDGFLVVGTSQPALEGDLELHSFKTISIQHLGLYGKRRSTVDREQLVYRRALEEKPLTRLGQLTVPTRVGNAIVCITLPTGVQSFDVVSYKWTNNPSLLNAATSVAVSPNRSLVAQTKDSIRIFSIDVLTSDKAHDDTRVSHVYPLDKNYIICVLQPTRHIAVLELETLREVRCDDETSSLWPIPAGKANSDPILPFGGGFDILNAMRAWRLGISLHERVQLDPEDAPRVLHGISPARTKIAIVNESTLHWGIFLYDTERERTITRLELQFGGGEVYDLTFDSETRFYLKIHGPEQHVQIPYEITPLPSDSDHQHTITKGEPMTLSEPRAPPPYTLDANREWVLDAQSRKICWISPGNLRRGNGGHFWAGLSLVMVGDDSVVRKVSFREPDC